MLLFYASMLNSSLAAGRMKLSLGNSLAKMFTCTGCDHCHRYFTAILNFLLIINSTRIAITLRRLLRIFFFFVCVFQISAFFLE